MRLNDAIIQHGTVARIRITTTAGSTPRDAGTEMLVWATGQSGTIGGGTLELQATEKARKNLTSGQSIQTTIPLGPTLGQCCGGSVSLRTDIFSAATQPDETYDIRNIWIYGAGHVGRALITTLAPLPDTQITWVDTASSRFPAAMPDNVTPLIAQNPSDATKHAPSNAEHLILTYSHAFDLAICHAVLSHSFGGAGLIGSATKWARFKSRLAALGHSPAQISRIICPIGDPSLGKHPHAIALGVASAMIRPAVITAKDRRA